ncbi:MULTISPECIES: hybrid sensor histidine kinase/response regulator [Rhizobium/Agrobacterium group]|uniref:histidine kinase n=1 Tax=Agrobacterium tomkonis CFBP 6623 TaxID=1183432 RepID=A0A1S7QFE8_9HYPH|nr:MULTISPECIES: PAS domain-containing hybrid sensor histidine kinase/response regulator [Rhizobium/Agrobacterium group]KRA58916.1 histidine kinase [Rhizobium sp. Root651]QCL87691.1 hybrid sensor histidine kinase/response regulator [Agrobacterium tumefaciens]TKT60222.1 hybrid sensor histidine kinase/response regulator [Agrobacterium sp. LC34]CUX36008.1 Two component sensor kinase/response regulator hybrid [Agrobacterium tomkonis CFBP 6623]
MSELAKLREKVSDGLGLAPVAAQPGDRVDATRQHAGAEHEIGSGPISSYIAISLSVGAFSAALIALAVPYAVTVALASFFGVVLVGVLFYALFGKTAPGKVALAEDLDVRLRQTQNRSLIAEMQESMGDIVVIRNLDRRIVEANRIFREMTGCSAPEGLSCEEIGIAFRPGDKVHAYDVEIATPFGQRIFSWHDAVTRDLASSRLLISSIARDVTEERLALAEREDARLRAEKADAEKARLLATVSHEIRLPLSGMLGMNHLLSQTKINEEQRNYLDGMKQSGQSLVQLVEDLLDYSTMEAGRFKLNPRAENLRRLIESIVEMLAHRAHEKGIEITSFVSPDVPDYLDFDPARLRQVLFNLLGNAVKFTREGGVVIRARMVEGELQMTVEDTGPGMSEREQARIFGEFEQAGPMSQRSAGTGLGLAISARIVREFGGSLTVSSHRGRGSIFTLSFRPGGAPAAMPDPGRRHCLQHTNVLLIAPKGVAAAVTMEAIEAFGGKCVLVHQPEDLQRLQDGAADLGADLTDIIVDRRVSLLFRDALKDWPQQNIRRTLLVSPEERPSTMHVSFDAWLIRPLREKSLIDVLCGRLRGIERRDALNDNHPDVGFSSRLKEGASGVDILVAEDDAVNARIIRAVLEKSGYIVRAVDDFQALRQSLAPGAARLPHLIISDLNMPGGEGLEVLPELLGTLEGERNIPVIVLSGDARADTAEILLKAGAAKVLAKPTDPRQLVEEIRRMLEAKRLSP